ncbi:MOS1T transposase, partial [Pseudoatta argentina]
MSIEQRANIKFCFKLGKTFTETFQLMQQVYGDDCLSRGRVHEWYTRFKNGREDINDDSHVGQAKFVITPESIEKVRDFLNIHPKSGQKVNAPYYLGVLRRLLHRIHRIRPEYREEGSWRLLHDNAPSHRSTLITDFLSKNRILLVNHSPYSPDLAPCDFYLFGKLHLPMKGMRYADIPAIQKACTDILRAMPANDLKSSFEKLLSCANQCIEGDYFE